MKAPLRTALFLSTALIAFGFHAEAAIVASVNNSTVSAYDTSVAENYVIFAGQTSGLGECLSPNPSSVCNSCTGMTDLCTPASTRCTQRSIHPSLKLQIDFSVDTIPTGGKVLIQMADGAGNLRDVTTDFNPSTTTPGANQNVNLQIEWSALCILAGTDSVCTADFAKVLNVGISADANATSYASGTVQKFTIRYTNAPIETVFLTGCGASDPFCAFVLSPGDKKVYVKQADLGKTGISGESGIKFAFMRLYSEKYIGAPAFCSIPLGTGAQFTDLPVKSKTEIKAGLAASTAGGLENEKDYMFNIATVDEATVVAGFMNPSNLIVGTHTARPGEVVGLLDNKSCFIATAAFGSSMAPQVEKLRQFRNQVLLPSDLGKKFVALYYEVSPPIADYIAQHETLRTFSRAMLWPLILFAELCALFGLLPTLLISLLAIGLTIFGIRRWNQRMGEA